MGGVKNRSADVVPIAQDLPTPTTGTERAVGFPATSHVTAENEQKPNVNQDIHDVYNAFARAVRAVGGFEWLCAALDRPPSYISKMGEALNRDGTRHVHLDWLVPLFDEQEGSRVLLEYLCERCGYEPPRRKRNVTPEELHRALIDELEDAGGVGDAVLERAARRLGVDRGAFRK